MNLGRHEAFIAGSGSDALVVHLRDARPELRRIEVRADGIAILSPIQPSTTSESEPGVPFRMLAETGICPPEAIEALWGRPAGTVFSRDDTPYRLYYWRGADERVLYLLAHPAVEQTRGPRDEVYQVQRYGKEFVQKDDQQLSVDHGTLLVPYRHHLAELSIPLLVAAGLTTLERVRTAAGFKV